MEKHLSAEDVVISIRVAIFALTHKGLTPILRQQKRLVPIKRLMGALHAAPRLRDSQGIRRSCYE